MTQDELSYRSGFLIVAVGDAFQESHPCREGNGISVDLEPFVVEEHFRFHGATPVGTR